MTQVFLGCILPFWSNEDVGGVQTVMVAWGEIMLKGRSLNGPDPVTPDLRDGDLIAALPSESEANRQALLAAQQLIERDTNKIALTARLKNI